MWSSRSGTISRLRAGKALEQLLEDEAGGEDCFPALQGACQETYFRERPGRVPAQRQGPDAGVHEDVHRLRSRL
jgi:hypothetical protein